MRKGAKKRAKLFKICFRTIRREENGEERKEEKGR